MQGVRGAEQDSPYVTVPLCPQASLQRGGGCKNLPFWAVAASFSDKQLKFQRKGSGGQHQSHHLCWVVPNQGTLNPKQRGLRNPSQPTQWVLMLPVMFPSLDNMNEPSLCLRCVQTSSLLGRGEDFGVGLTVVMNKRCLHQHTRGPKRPWCSPWCGSIQSLAGTLPGHPSMGKPKKKTS